MPPGPSWLHNLVVAPTRVGVHEQKNRRVSLQIGSKPGEQVFQARKGGDTYLVFSAEDRMLYLYTTVETMLCPSITAYEGEMNRPYFWAESTGMMSVLSEVSRCSFAHVEDVEDAKDVLEFMEVNLGSV